MVQVLLLIISNNATIYPFLSAALIPELTFMSYGWRGMVSSTCRPLALSSQFLLNLIANVIYSCHVTVIFYIILLIIQLQYEFPISFNFLQLSIYLRAGVARIPVAGWC